MKFCNLVKLMDQYCGKKFQPCRGFQYEVTEATKWPELFHVKGSLASARTLAQIELGNQYKNQIYSQKIYNCLKHFMQPISKSFVK